METDTCKSKIQINGYFVYTRRKRNHHRDSDNEEPKRLKIDENADAVKNDAVKWTSKRQRRPSFKVKVDSGEDVSGAAKLAAEKSVAIEKNETVCEKWLTMKELFDTGFLDGVPVVYVGCKKQVKFLLHFISFFKF